MGYPQGRPPPRRCGDAPPSMVATKRESSAAVCQGQRRSCISREQARYPELVRAIGNDILGQVGIDRPSMVAVRRHDVSPSLFWLQTVFPHQATELLAIHHNALVAQCCSNPPVAVSLELVADRASLDEKSVVKQHGWLRVVEGGSREPHQLAPPADGGARGPVTTEVLALFGRGACFKAPCSSSISSVWRPTRHSRVAILTRIPASGRPPAGRHPKRRPQTCRPRSGSAAARCSATWTARAASRPR